MRQLLLPVVDTRIDLARMWEQLEAYGRQVAPAKERAGKPITRLSGEEIYSLRRAFALWTKGRFSPVPGHVYLWDRSHGL